MKSYQFLLNFGSGNNFHELLKAVPESQGSDQIVASEVSIITDACEINVVFINYNIKVIDNLSY